MKNLITLIAIFLILACKQEAKTETAVSITNPQKKEVGVQNTLIANYSSLFDSYSCNISVAELAKALDTSALNIAIGKNNSAEHCVFTLKGFGKGYENTGTKLRFGSGFSTKKNNKKVITKALEEKKKMPSGKMVAGRDIVLANAGDCYIMIQSLQGRVLILNENYKRLFLMSYGSKASVQGRTKEQHDAITKKVKALANYLVSKHKK